MEENFIANHLFEGERYKEGKHLRMPLNKLKVPWENAKEYRGRSLTSAAVAQNATVYAV